MAQKIKFSEEKVQGQYREEEMDVSDYHSKMILSRK